MAYVIIRTNSETDVIRQIDLLALQGHKVHTFTVLRAGVQAFTYVVLMEKAA